MFVFMWRLSRLAATAVFRWPKQIIAVVIVIAVLGGLGAGLVSAAAATGLGPVLFLIVGIAAVAFFLLIPTMVTWSSARGVEADAVRMQPRNAYVALVTRWELGTVEPAEVIAEIGRWRAAGWPEGRWEARMREEAQDALATGTTARRDARVKVYRDYWAGVGLPIVAKEFSDSSGEMWHP